MSAAADVGAAKVALYTAIGAKGLPAQREAERIALTRAAGVLSGGTPEEIAEAALVVSIITARRLVHLDAEGDRR